MAKDPQFFVSAAEGKPVIPVTKENVASLLIQAGYSSGVAHRTERVLTEAEEEGYVRSFLIRPTECIICGSRNMKDLVIDVFLPDREKSVYVHAICTKDRVEA